MPGTALSPDAMLLMWLWCQSTFRVPCSQIHSLKQNNPLQLCQESDISPIRYLVGTPEDSREGVIDRHHFHTLKFHIVSRSGEGLEIRLTITKSWSPSWVQHRKNGRRLLFKLPWLLGKTSSSSRLEVLGGRWVMDSRSSDSNLHRRQAIACRWPPCCRPCKPPGKAS